MACHVLRQLVEPDSLLVHHAGVPLLESRLVLLVLVLVKFYSNHDIKFFKLLMDHVMSY